MSVRLLTIAGMSITIFPDAATACEAAAEIIAETTRKAVTDRGRAVLGLATGKTPQLVYERLVAIHRAGNLSFKDVSTYNLDEYYPIRPTDPNSYRVYMDRHLFDHVDVRANHAHLFDGTVPEGFTAEHAAGFDRWIAAEGGLDLQLLGIGRNGHIGFNEPSDLTVEEASRLPSRVMPLHPTTVADAVADFGEESLVPRRAITLGTASILAARSIVVLAFGSKKSDILRRSLEGPITAEVPASLLQSVPNRVTWMIDEAAAVGL